MNMIVFAVEFDEFSFEIGADVRKNELQIIKDSFVKDISAVFGEEDQMHMKIKNDMSTVTDFSLLFITDTVIIAAIKPIISAMQISINQGTSAILSAKV